MRRCVTVIFVLLLLLVIKPGIEMLLNSATANDGSQMSNDKSAPTATHALIEEHKHPACWSLRLATTNCSFVSLFVRSSCCRDNSTSTRPARTPHKVVPLYGAIRSVSVSV